MKKAVVCFAVLVLFLTIFMTTADAAGTYNRITSANGSDYTNSSFLANRLDQIFSGNASIYSNNNCTTLVNVALGNSTVPNNGVNLYVGPYGGPRVNAGTSCAVYAKGVYYTLFGECPVSGYEYESDHSELLTAAKGNKITYENFIKWGVRQGVGAHVRVGNHSIIVLGYTDSLLTFVEGNGDGNGHIRIVEVGWDNIPSQNRLKGNIVGIFQPTESWYRSTFWGDNYSTLDVNGYLDGASTGSIDGYGAFDLTIGDDFFANRNDFCDDYPSGTSYRISNIQTDGIHTYHGVKSGSLEGTLQSGRTEVSLNIRTNDDVGSGFYAYITNQDGSLQLYNQHAGTAGDNVGAEAPSTDPSHIWYFEKLNSNNHYKITSAYDGRSLDVLNYGQANGTNLQLRPYSGNTAQTWIIHKEGNLVEIGALCTPCIIDCGEPDGSAFNAYMNWDYENGYQWFRLQQTNYTPPSLKVTTNKANYTLGETVTINWSGGVNVKGYVWGVQQNGETLAAEQVLNVSQTSATWKPTAAGSYVALAAYVAKDNSISDWSKYSFEVTNPKYYLDLKGSLDGAEKDSLQGMGTADIYINGTQVGTGTADYYVQWPTGTPFEVKNIKAFNGYKYAGPETVTGTVGNGKTTIILPFVKTYLIDLNATLDGQKIYNIAGIGRAALLINDESISTSAITDYNERWPSGTKWQFHVVPMEGYNYYPGGSTNLSGTIGNSNVETVLMFTTKTYKITYNANGGSGAPSEQVKRHNEDLPLSSSIPVRTGYDFIGWARSSTATTAEYQPEDYFDRDVDTTLYAVWRIKTYTVTYNANGGTGAPSNQSKNHGTTLMLSSTTPTRANSSAGSCTVTLNANGGSVSQSSITAARTTSYTFKNWNTKSDGSGTAYNAGASYTANVDATLYAQWNSSTNTAEITLPTPIRGGCDFVGWSTSSNASSGVTGKYTPSGNVTLYAIWKPKTYTVKYDANGGTGAPSNQTKYHGTALTLSSVKPTRADSSAGSYTVTLNANGGKVNLGSLSAARTNNYTFKCWNIRADGSGTDYEAGANFNLNENTTLYAQWRIGSTVYSVTLPTPTREGYSFQGWATSKNATSGMTGNYVPGNNVTLFAIWKELEPDFVLPSALREIGEEAFVGGAFTYVHVPENVTKIGSRAFANCSRLKNIDIPVATTALDPSAFDGVTGLTIHGADGSYAEFFASKHGYNFIAVP